MTTCENCAEIEDLRADNERLRSVLQYISIHDEHPTVVLGEMHTEVVPYGWARHMVRVARAALDDKPRRCACCGLNYSRSVLCRECNMVGETHDCPV